MSFVSYQRIVSGTSITGKFGESMQATEKWQIRVDSPAVNTSNMLAAVSSTSGVTWGSAHPFITALKAQEFELSPEGSDGMRWILTVKYSVPKRQPDQAGIPGQQWERMGGTSTVPLFKDTSGVTITNAAGDPIEGLEKEREEVAWALTKCYSTNAALEADVFLYAGELNESTWSGYAAKTVKCYFKSAKLVSVSKLDGSANGGTLQYIETRWEFQYEPDTWMTKPWDVGFMELVGGSRKAIVGSDGKAVKQPVALNSNGTKKADGQKPVVINNGAGADIYTTTDWTTAFGTPAIIPTV